MNAYSETYKELSKATDSLGKVVDNCSDEKIKKVANQLLGGVNALVEHVVGEAEKAQRKIFDDTVATGLGVGQVDQKGVAHVQLTQLWRDAG